MAKQAAHPNRPSFLRHFLTRWSAVANCTAGIALAGCFMLAVWQPFWPLEAFDLVEPYRIQYMTMSDPLVLAVRGIALFLALTAMALPSLLIVLPTYLQWRRIQALDETQAEPSSPGFRPVQVSVVSNEPANSVVPRREDQIIDVVPTSVRRLNAPTPPVKAETFIEVPAPTPAAVTSPEETDFVLVIKGLDDPPATLLRELLAPNYPWHPHIGAVDMPSRPRDERIIHLLKHICQQKSSGKFTVTFDGGEELLMPSERPTDRIDAAKEFLLWLTEQEIPGLSVSLTLQQTDAPAQFQTAEAHLPQQLASDEPGDLARDGAPALAFHRGTESHDHPSTAAPAHVAVAKPAASTPLLAADAACELTPIKLADVFWHDTGGSATSLPVELPPFPQLNFSWLELGDYRIPASTGAAA